MLDFLKPATDLNSPGKSNQKKSRVSQELVALASPIDRSSQGNNSFFKETTHELLLLNDWGTEVGVRITASNVNTLLPDLKALGFQTTTAVSDLNLVEGILPVSALTNTEALASKGLLGVTPIYKPISYAGSVTSQADFVHQSDRVRASLPMGYDGTGVRIGVMSDSYNSLGGAAADITSEDLPAAGVQVLQDLAAGQGTDEGRAMLQLIHDLAPGASLAFSSVFFGEANFAQQIRDLADPTKGNAKILVDDVVYFSEPYFQDGIVAQAVDEVVDNYGAAYFSSAGNQRNQAYESTQAYESNPLNFASDPLLDSSIGYLNTYYDFDGGAGVDPKQRITLNPGQTIRLALQWDDPFYTANGVDTDLDIFLLNTAGNVLLKSTTDNVANQTPFEILSATYTGNTPLSVDIAIAKYAGPNPGRLKYVNFGSAIASEYALNSSTISPHAAASNGMAVAAVPYFNQTTPEAFTSVGNSTLLFNPDGTRKATPEVRQKPDIAAIDGTDTTFFGSSDVDSNGKPNFFGTSAAAPHAAAIAALVKQANPDFTPNQLYERLKTTAKDLGTPGVDNVTGAGLINAYSAIFGASMPATLNFFDGFESGVLSNNYTLNSTGAGRIQVTNANSPASGTRHVTMDSSANGAASLNEMILHVNPTNFNNVNLSFKQKEFNDVDHAMSETFAGSQNSDGVALSVDGTNWYRLFNLTGTNSTNSYQTKTINLSNFAASKNLSLGSDVQIKFQQYGGSAISSAGFAFDDISVTGNAPPVVTLPAGTLNYNENSGYALIDSTATASDDSPTLNGGKLTVKFIGGATAQDLLLIRNQGLSPGQIGAGIDVPLLNFVTFSGVPIGNLKGGMNGTPLEITFNTNFATPTAIQALLRNISYGNTADDPIAGDRTVEFTLTDSLGATTKVSKTINLNAINDAPLVGVPGATFNLYNGSGTPNSQGFFYQTLPHLPIAATQNNGQLNTTGSLTDYAGYIGKPELIPSLDRSTGYSIKFDAQIFAENHSEAKADKNGDGISDRAGFSVIVIGNDQKGIELGFWENQIWAQQDDPNGEPPTGNLFTHTAEQTGFFDTKTNPVSYEVKVLGNNYELFANNNSILTGNLRDYTNFQPEAFLPQDPYETENFVFFGDNSPYASANFNLGAVSITTGSSTPVPLSVDESTDLIVPGIRTIDVDAASSNITVSLKANNGKLTVNSAVSGGVTAANISNNGTGLVTLTDTTTAINKTLADPAGLIYRGNLDFNGSDTLTVTANDGGNNGSGGVKTNTQTLAITVIPDGNVTGTDASEFFATTTLVDQIDALGGDDTITSTFANIQQSDRLDAGTGIDTFVLTNGSATDTITFKLNNAINQVTNISGLSLKNFERLDLSNFNGRANITGLSSANSIIGGAGNDTVTGGVAGDAIAGNAGNDNLNGAAGNDTLNGGDGNDILNGNVGDDSMKGGAGNDTYYVDSATDIVVETADEGSDRVNSSIHYILLPEIENLTLTGTAAINGIGNNSNNAITGNAANNTLVGNAGNDNLNGAAGNDTLNGGDGNDILNGNVGDDSMKGGAGNDTYYVDSISDIVVETANEGSDRVNSSIHYILLPEIENLTLTGTAAIDGLGNNLNNAITGNSATNVLVGETGNDTLNGGAGNDILDGGRGNDVLTGGTGADQLVYATGGAFATTDIGIDRITGFVTAEDKILLSKQTFSVIASAIGSSLSVGTEFAAVNSDAAASTSNALIVYNTANGKLFYNENQNAAGFGTGAQFATLSGLPALAASDFLIIA